MGGLGGEGEGGRNGSGGVITTVGDTWQWVTHVAVRCRAYRPPASAVMTDLAAAGGDGGDGGAGGATYHRPITGNGPIIRSLDESSAVYHLQHGRLIAPYWLLFIGWSMSVNELID